MGGGSEPSLPLSQDTFAGIPLLSCPRFTGTVRMLVRTSDNVAWASCPCVAWPSRPCASPCLVRQQEQDAPATHGRDARATLRSSEVPVRSSLLGDRLGALFHQKVTNLVPDYSPRLSTIVIGWQGGQSGDPGRGCRNYRPGRTKGHGCQRKTLADKSCQRAMRIRLRLRLRRDKPGFAPRQARGCAVASGR